jgi:hypothetical protein
MMMNPTNLIDTLGMLTPRLLARIRSGSHLLLQDVPPAHVAEAQSDLEMEVVKKRLLKRRPEPDLAAVDPGPYYLAPREAGFPLSKLDQPLNRKTGFRHYLAAQLVTHLFEKEALASNGELPSDALLVGRPLILQNEENEEKPARLEADWIYSEVPEDGGVILTFLENRQWRQERAFEYLENLDRFLAFYAGKYQNYLAYESTPWLYGHVILVHTAPNEESPMALALAAAPWRTALQSFEAEYGYRPMVSIGHVNRLLQCCEIDQVIAYAYDLTGYC